MHLQMCGEKLVKAYLVRQGAPYIGHHAVHNHFANLKLIILSTPSLRTALMGTHGTRGKVNLVLRSMERTMLRVESLNPSVARPFNASPNCEYPWVTGSPPNGHAPVRYRFGSAVGYAARVKLYSFLDKVLKAERA